MTATAAEYRPPMEAVSSASPWLPGAAPTERQGMPSFRRRWRSAGATAAAAKAARPPISRQACAKARQRMTWPPPIPPWPSARRRSDAESRRKDDPPAALAAVAIRTRLEQEAPPDYVNHGETWHGTAHLGQWPADQVIVLPSRGSSGTTLSCIRLSVNTQKSKDGRSISLRPAAPGDEMLLYDWQRHPQTRQFARNPQPPTLQEHREWFRQRLESPDCIIRIILCDDKAAEIGRGHV